MEMKGLYTFTGLPDWYTEGNFDFDKYVILENCEMTEDMFRVRMKIGWAFTSSLLKRMEQFQAEFKKEVARLQ
jgi:hypothetical protein